MENSEFFLPQRNAHVYQFVYIYLALKNQTYSIAYRLYPPYYEYFFLIENEFKFTAITHTFIT